MEPNLENYYNLYDDLFLTDGWKQFVADFTKNANVINSVEATTDNDDLRFRKGQLNIIASIIHLEEMIKQSREAAEAEGNAEDI